MERRQSQQAWCICNGHRTSNTSDKLARLDHSFLDLFYLYFWVSDRNDKLLQYYLRTYSGVYKVVCYTLGILAPVRSRHNGELGHAATIYIMIHHGDFHLDQMVSWDLPWIRHVESNHNMPGYYTGV